MIKEKQHTHADSHVSEQRHDAVGEILVKPDRRNIVLSISMVVSALIIGGALVYYARMKSAAPEAEQSPVTASAGTSAEEFAVDQEQVIPSAGVTLPIVWGDLGTKLVETGVIDRAKFTSLYEQRGGLSSDMEALLTRSDNGELRITPENAQVLLNLAWALGLGNKNPILDEGPMVDTQYGGAENFASTGGWTLAQGDPMDHYSKHTFISLSSEQQAVVERVAQGVYRPCCGNSTYFPDCNHGMAMLGLFELMASQGVPEEEMYKAALILNSYWFPDTYLTIAKFFAQNGYAWDRVNPQEVLDAPFSSAVGYRQVLAEVSPVQASGGGGCGV